MDHHVDPVELAFEEVLIGLELERVRHDARGIRDHAILGDDGITFDSARTWHGIHSPTQLIARRHVSTKLPVRGNARCRPQGAVNPCCAAPREAAPDRFPAGRRANDLTRRYRSADRRGRSHAPDNPFVPIVSLRLRYGAGTRLRSDGAGAW